MKSVVFTLKNQLGDFTKKEKQVARFIIKYPQVVIDSNANRLLIKWEQRCNGNSLSQTGL